MIWLREESLALMAKLYPKARVYVNVFYIDQDPCQHPVPDMLHEEYSRQTYVLRIVSESVQFMPWKRLSDAKFPVILKKSLFKVHFMCYNKICNCVFGGGICTALTVSEHDFRNLL